MRGRWRGMGRHIPGNPTIVPKNVPGAGGLIAANTLYNNTAPDGLTFAALTNGAAMDPLFGETAARFDGQKFNWLGSIGKLENICVTWKGKSPITRIEQARAKRSPSALRERPAIPRSCPKSSTSSSAPSSR